MTIHDELAELSVLGNNVYGRCTKLVQELSEFCAQRDQQIKYMTERAQAAELLVARAAAGIRALPMSPGTKVGTRQQWLRECAARTVEGRRMPAYPDDTAR